MNMEESDVNNEFFFIQIIILDKIFNVEKNA